MQLLLIFCAVIGLIAAQSGIIDDYAEISVVQTNSGNPMDSETKMSAGIIGGERTLTSVYEGGPLSITASILEDRFSLSSDVGTRGQSIARYAGPGGAGFVPPVDFTADGCDCWNGRLISSDNQLLFEFEIEPAGLSSFAIPIDVGPPGIDVCLPFEQANFANYQAATSLEIRLVGSAVPELDASIAYVCCQPRVDCWHEFDSMNVDVGVAVSMKLTCTNYDSLPLRPENIDVSFGFDMDIALVENANCDSGITPSIVNNAMEYSALIIPGGMVMCTFDIVGVDGGTLMDIGAVITIAPGLGTPARSNDGGPRFGTPAFCGPPTLSELVIQLPPTTLPPTTLPPTTAPPTTLPPTTLPPTTQPPTTQPPTTLPPTTQPPTTQPPTTQPPTTQPPTTQPPTTAPPTTNPPTTQPPTTQPPTTLPPTTLPPRPATSVCVTPMIVDGACQCTVFPCFTRDDGDIECEASEWYCIYYRTVPPNGIINFTFRGIDCTCMI